MPYRNQPTGFRTALPRGIPFASVLACFALQACASPADQAAAKQEQVADDPAAMMRIAAIAEASQDWSAADTFYRRAAELDPNDGAAKLSHARMLARQGDMDGALATLRDAHRANGANLDVTAALGRMLAAGRRPAEALSVFDDGLQSTPKAVPLLLGRGVVLDMLDRHAEAQAAYRECLSLDPDNAAAHKDLELSVALAARARGEPKT